MEETKMKFVMIASLIFLICGCSPKIVHMGKPIGENYSTERGNPVVNEKQIEINDKLNNSTRIDIEENINRFSRLLAGKKNKPNNSDDVVRGLTAFHKGDYVEANFYFQHALKFEPQNAHLHKLNAICYHLRGQKGDPTQYDLADVGYDLATRLDPGDSSIPYYQGILSYSRGRHKAAQDYFARAILINNRESKYYLGLAASSYYLGQLERAYINIRKAKEMDPESKSTLQASGLIHAAIGAFKKAKADSRDLISQSGDSSDRSRQAYLERRIEDWDNYYQANGIKKDKDLQLLMAQNVDIYGVPTDGNFKAMDQGSSDNEADYSPIEQKSTNSQNLPDPAIAAKRELDTVSKGVKNRALSKKSNKPNMALIDVAIIRTEEIYKSNKGVNLLNGLNLFFSGDDSFFIGQTFGKDMRVKPTVNNQFTIKLGTNAAGLNYSLNIFNDNYDRNQVIARPTILVQDKQKSSFFSGGTMHVVLEGGVAGSGSVEPIPIGVTLEVKPTFLDDDTINIYVFAKRTYLESTLSQVSDQLTGTSFAQTSETKISANLTLNYGETMVLSGLSDQEKENLDDKVPVLGDLPVAQYLFRNNTKTSAKRTVLILLTPRYATLAYEDGVSVNPEAGFKSGNLDVLETNLEWMKPSSNLEAIVYQLGKYRFFNQYRKGDIMLEDWAGEGNFFDAINRTLDYFYIRYGYDHSDRSNVSEIAPSKKRGRGN